MGFDVIPAIDLRGGRCVRYTPCAPAHHHHIVCRSCGRVEEVDLAGLDVRLSAIARTEFELAANGSSRVSSAQIATHRMKDAACQLVFVNGRFARELSSCERLPDGLLVRSLARQIAEAPEAIEPYLGRYLNIERDAFCALNSAFLEDGAYIHIRRGAIIEAPVHLLFVSAANHRATMNHPRNLIVAEDSSQLAVVEDYVSLDGSVALSNAATEVVAGEEAGATLPFGCRMGICHTCVGKLCSGKIRDLRTGEVSGSEGEIVRTCVNAPEGPIEIAL